METSIERLIRQMQQQCRESSFVGLSEEEVEAHLNVARYGDFVLTEAVRPAYDRKVVPRQGYRHDSYHDNTFKVPVLMAAVSRERLFEVFMDLLSPLGPVVDVVLESSHNNRGEGSGRHLDLYREHIDLPVLTSTLIEYEDNFVHDGCLGVAVLNKDVPLEVQLDEHKLLIVYGEELKFFEQVLRRHEIICDDDLQFITEAEHVHSSDDNFVRQLEELKCRLDVESFM